MQLKKANPSLDGKPSPAPSMLAADVKKTPPTEIAQGIKKDDPKISLPPLISNDKPAAQLPKISWFKKTFGKLYMKVILGAVICLLAIIIIGLVTVCIGLTRYNWQNSFSRKIADIVNLPVMIRESHIIPISNFINDVSTLKYFYNAQETQNPGAVTQPTDSYIKKSVLSRMIREDFLSAKAKEFKLTVTQADIDSEYASIVAQAGDEQTVKTTLTQMYNWTPEQFKQKVLEPYLIKAKVQEYVGTSDTINADALKRAQDVLAKLNAGAKFEDLAKQYSEDTTASNGGDLGFFSAGQMVKPFEDATFALEVGKTSGIVKTQYGFHIIKLLEKTEATTDKPAQYHAAHILIKSMDIDTWTDGELAKEGVTVLLAGYKWQKDCALILGKSDTCTNNELTNQASSAAPTDTNSNTNSATNTNASVNTNTASNTNTGG